MSGADAGADAGTGLDASRRELDRMRAELAQADDELIRLLARRVALARGLLPLKRALGQPVLDPSREAAVVRTACQQARELGLPEEEVRAIVWRVIGLCRRTQEAE